MSSPPRIAFSTLAFPDATLASATSLGRRWGYSGIELRLIDGELIDPSMPAADRVRVKRTVTAAELPVVAVDSSIRLTDDDPGPELRRFLELASDWESPLVRVFGGALAAAEPGPSGSSSGPPRRCSSPRCRSPNGSASPSAWRRTMPSPPPRSWPSCWPWSTRPQSTLERSARCGTAITRTGWVRRPAEVYANLGPRILLAQVKDARRHADGDWQLVLLGEGEVPVREMLGLLVDGGYPHWISVEWEKRWHPEIEEPEVALPQHLELLTKWLDR